MTSAVSVALAVVALGPAGIGAIHFGLPKAKTVAALDARFGAPTWRGENTGCGAKFTEVEWGTLVVEFRSGVFTGYRSLAGGFADVVHGAPRATALTPNVATARSVKLGSTLAQVRAAYGSLRRVGADSWRAPNGIVFVDNAKRDPVPASSRIVEIKIDTCGAF